MNINLITMAAIRMLYGVVSLSGGLLMLYYKDLQSAVKINGIIGSVGPFVFLFVSAIGVAGLAGQIDLRKLGLLLMGITLIMLATR
ncbi:MAG: DUF2619 domain-containing protein [Firmicutes bacterium]|nr:DUF2619 domain-containing protein [Bacillota bacterium]